jgi:hypothetical protein
MSEALIVRRGGQKFAEGSSAGAAATTNTISGLSFRPRFITITEVGNESFGDQFRGVMTVSGIEYTMTQGGTAFAFIPTVYDDGFDITFGTNVTDVYWAAFG